MFSKGSDLGSGEFVDGRGGGGRCGGRIDGISGGRIDGISEGDRKSRANSDTNGGHLDCDICDCSRKSRANSDANGGSDDSRLDCDICDCDRKSRANFDANVVAISNRKLVSGQFLNQVDKVCQSGISALVLREKDLSPKEYKALALDVIKICAKNQVQCILHSFVDVACALGHRAIHLPLASLLDMSDEAKAKFDIIGASTHSLLEARQARQAGATYITASHIFETDCKAGLAPRGLEFLKQVCAEMDIPVLALGGINLPDSNNPSSNASLCIDAGASGVCIMSAFMKLK